MMDPKWRVITLSFMGLSLIFITVATMSTGWRFDHESRMTVDTTFGLWRICRAIKFGATTDHKCLASLANDAPPWYHCVRAFMLMSVLCVLVAFILGVRTVAKVPVLKHPQQKPPPAPMILPAILMFIAMIFGMVGLATFGVATHMREALYFPEKLPPTWANSWAQVWAKLDSLPSDRPDIREINISYGYSFGLGWFGIILSLISFILNIIAKS